MSSLRKSLVRVYLSQTDDIRWEENLSELRKRSREEQFCSSLCMLESKEEARSVTRNPLCARLGKWEPEKQKDLLDWTRSQTERPMLFHIGGYRVVNNEHLQHSQVVCGQHCNHDGFHGLLCTRARGCGLQGSGRENGSDISKVCHLRWHTDQRQFQR